jgi:8-oxo-dGTP pyrophosphatase MutT (NUDIX family)
MTERASWGPSPPPVVRAAGGIVLRAAVGGGWEVAVVHRPVASDWTLPKGKVDPGETATACALREVLEETGCVCELGRFAGEVEYLDRRNRPKVVSYWLMQPIDGEFSPNDEVDELRWLPIGEAARLLSYDHDRELLVSVTSPIAASSE